LRRIIDTEHTRLHTQSRDTRTQVSKYDPLTDGAVFAQIAGGWHSS